MNNDRNKLLQSYIISNIAPILEDFIFGCDIPNSIIIPANINVEELIGYYENDLYLEPKWFNEITSTTESKILVIDNIDSISIDEQLKFVELLKYRKTSTFELPKNIIIIVTAKNINKNTINEEIYSLVVHIR